MISYSLHYWLVIARAFQAFGSSSAGTASPMPSPSELEEETPEEITAQARICLQVLIRLYLATHGSDMYNYFLILEASFIGFAAMGDVSAATNTTTASYEA